MQQALWIGGFKSARQSPHIARQPSRSIAIHPSKDIARQRLLKRLCVRRAKGGEIGSLPPVECFAELAHPLRHSQVADTHFAQIGIEIETVKSCQQHNNVEHNQVKAPIHGIRDAVGGVKDRDCATIAP